MPTKAALSKYTHKCTSKIACSLTKMCAANAKGIHQLNRRKRCHGSSQRRTKVRCQCLSLAQSRQLIQSKRVAQGSPPILLKSAPPRPPDNSAEEYAPKAAHQPSRNMFTSGPVSLSIFELSCAKVAYWPPMLCAARVLNNPWPPTKVRCQARSPALWKKSVAPPINTEPPINSIENCGPRQPTNPAQKCTAKTAHQLSRIHPPT